MAGAGNVSCLLVNGGTGVRNFAKKESVRLVIGLTLQRIKKKLPLDD